MVCVPPGMNRLFSGLSGVDTIVEHPLPTEGFDVQVPFTIIPAIPGCELTPERVSVVPYLFAEGDAVQRWAPTFADRSMVHIGVPAVLEQKTTICCKYLYLLASLKDSLGLGGAYEDKPQRCGRKPCS